MKDKQGERSIKNREPRRANTALTHMLPKRESTRPKVETSPKAKARPKAQNALRQLCHWRQLSKMARTRASALKTLTAKRNQNSYGTSGQPSGVPTSVTVTSHKNPVLMYKHRRPTRLKISKEPPPSSNKIKILCGSLEPPVNKQMLQQRPGLKDYTNPQKKWLMDPRTHQPIYKN